MTFRPSGIGTLKEVPTFVEGSGPVDIELADRASACDFVRRTLVRFSYHAEGKAAKAVQGVLWEGEGAVAG